MAKMKKVGSTKVVGGISTGSDMKKMPKGKAMKAGPVKR